MRLIDADSLPRHGNRGGLVNWYDIEKAPTVDAVKHGHWIEVNDPIISCKCSVCDAEYYLYEDDIYGYPYCANCGAKMERKEE